VRWIHEALPRKFARPFVSALERLTIPGIQLHYALRKLYLEEVARAALAERFRQVGIFGAGYDTLALRLHETFPDALFIELDHPATQRRKTQALAARHDTSQISNLHFLPIDLTRQRLNAALRKFDGYRADAPTLFIAEGLLMYLSPVEVDDLFQTIRESGGPFSRFAFTFMEPQGDGRINFRTRSRVVDLWLNLRREVFKWGIKRSELDRYLAARGFAIRDLATHETFRRRYLEPHTLLARLPLAAGEYVCVADRDGKEN
jgi:methyltransferase (TIGR00027 family)